MKAIKAHRPAHWQAFAKATVGLFAVVIAVATCTDALAMRHHLKLLAWSSDGASALLANKVRDREGGGALGYRVIRADGKTDLRLEVSKLTNPGAGSKRQRVTRKRCLRRLGQLRSTLRRLRFRGVGVVASACAGKERSGLVEIDDKTRAAVAASWLKRARSKSPSGGLVVDLQDHHVTVRLRGRLLFKSSRKVARVRRVRGAKSASSRMMVIVGHGAGSSHLVSILRKRSGKPAGWVEVR